jgi:alanine racemase
VYGGGVLPDLRYTGVNRNADIWRAIVLDGTLERRGMVGFGRELTSEDAESVPIGYADGWSRSSSPGGFALVDGARVPIVGRVSSDAITVDVSEVDGVDHDSEFTLLGRDRDAEITADEVAAVRDTIAWEVLQQLGARLARVYFAGGSSIAMRAESTTTTTGARAELGTPY